MADEARGVDLDAAALSATPPPRVAAVSEVVGTASTGVDEGPAGPSAAGTEVGGGVVAPPPVSALLGCFVAPVGVATTLRREVSRPANGSRSQLPALRRKALRLRICSAAFASRLASPSSLRAWSARRSALA